MGKTSSAVKRKYNAKAYDRIEISVPKGRKQAVEAFAKEQGESVSGLINRLLQREIGISEQEWKKHTADEIDGDPA